MNERKTENIVKNKSKILNKYTDYAVDGAKLYADYLSKELDVLFIGVSEQNEKELKVSHYFQLKGESEIQAAFDNEILDFNSYVETYKQVRFRANYKELFKYVVFDNCCGTGGFWVVAMQKMIQLAKGDLPKIDHIKKQQLVETEYQDHILTSYCSNIILHGKRQNKHCKRTLLHSS